MGHQAHLPQVLDPLLRPRQGGSGSLHQLRHRLRPRAGAEVEAAAAVRGRPGRGQGTGARTTIWRPKIWRSTRTPKPAPTRKSIWKPATTISASRPPAKTTKARSLRRAGGQFPLFQRGKVRLRRARTWGRSSAGRASQWHCEGQGFDPPRLHHPHQSRALIGSVQANLAPLQHRHLPDRRLMISSDQFGLSTLSIQREGAAPVRPRPCSTR